jgi:hypothetical protein
MWVQFISHFSLWLPTNKNKVAPLEGKLMCHPTPHQHSSRSIFSISLKVKKIGDFFFGITINSDI